MTTSWKKFSALIPVAALSFMDQTILPVALPAIQEEMGASGTALQWSVNAYLLAISVFVLVSGKLSDRIGHKNALISGISGFVLFSTLCSLSQNIWMLIIARGFQGMSAAFMFPSQTAMVAHIFPPEKRGRATGMIVSIGALFMVLGPLVGGYLTQNFSWRWIFWINWPIGVVGLWLICKFLPSTGRRALKIDLWGFTFFAIGTSSLTLLFMQAAEWGWTSDKTLISLGLAVLGFFLLMRREKRTPHPFLDLTLFKRPIYAAINISVPTIQFIIMITVSRTLYLEEILNYSPLETGFITFISSSPVLFMAPLAGLLSDRYGSKVPIACGYLLIIFSFFWLAFDSLPSLLTLMLSLIAFGAGVPFIFTPSISSAISSVPQEKTGVAMGMIFTLRMLGGTIGLALIHLFITTVHAARLPVVGEKAAEIASFSAVHFALGFLLILAFAVTFILHSKNPTHHPPEGPAEGWD
jgi:EmrB/QacA subfamily drug resistance transporter